MLTRIQFLMMSLVLTGAFLNGARAVAAEQKFAWIDVQKAIQETSSGKKAKKDLEKEFAEKKKDLDKKKADLDKMQEDLEKKKSVLSDDARQKKQAEFQAEAMKFQQMVQQTEYTFRGKETDALKPIIDKLQDTIDKVAKEQGYTMVFVRSDKTFEQTVVWAKKEVDITDDVVKAFEKTVK